MDRTVFDRKNRVVGVMVVDSVVSEPSDQTVGIFPAEHPAGCGISGDNQAVRVENMNPVTDRIQDIAQRVVRCFQPPPRRRAWQRACALA